MQLDTDNAILTTELGYMRPVAGRDGLVRLDWQQSPFQLKTDDAIPNHLDIACQAAREIAEYLKGVRQDFTVPIDFSQFTTAMKAWYQVLLTVPYGDLWSYGELAKAWGNPKAARPAGQACRRNPIPIIIPCHRINTSAGGPNQYSGGSETTPTDAGNLSRKLWLQNMESHYR